MLKETQHVEFKPKFNEDVIETLVAFANTKGGRVIVGVDDSGKPLKNFTTGKETLQDLGNKVKTNTQPQIIPDVDFIEIDGQEVIKFEVQEYPVKPVSTRGKYYKRVRNSNHQLSVQEISDVYMQSMQYSWDAYPYPKAGVGSINWDKVIRFVAKVNLEGRFILPKNPQNALIKLKMLQDDIPTNAAMILFSKENLLYNVHIGRFKTPSMIIADKMINGNLYDVVEESMQTIIGHLKFAFEITGQTTQRTEIPEYPLDAIRELLLNAVVHRDYQSSTDVQIKIFDNRITFFNPGKLYGNITEEDLLTDSYQASTRNKQIAEAFYLTHDIEKYGSGFVRIRKAIEDYPTMKFNFQEFANGFVSEFSYTEQKTNTKTHQETYKTHQETHQTHQEIHQETHQEDLDKILDLISLMENKQYSTKEMMDLLGLNDIVNFRVQYRTPAVKGGYISMLYHDNPKHRNQKYFLTEKGLRANQETHQEIHQTHQETHQENLDKILDLISLMENKQYSTKGMMDLLGLNDIVNFRIQYRSPAIKAGYISMLYPNNPKQRNQKYFLTEKGLRAKAATGK